MGGRVPQWDEPSLGTSCGTPSQSQTDTEGRRWEGTQGGQGKTDAGAAMMWPQAKGRQGAPEAGRGKKDPPLELQGPATG